MNDGWEPLSIEGVVRRRLIGHEDERGGFTELWRSSWTEMLTVRSFAQSNLSRSREGVLRGMHFHLHQADLWIVLDGRAWVGLADLRDASEDPSWRPRTALLELGRDEAFSAGPRRPPPWPRLEINDERWPRPSMTNCRICTARG